MTRAVWKYAIPVDDEDHDLPVWPVHVEPAPGRRDVLNVWCEVHPDQPPRTVPYRVFGTGQPIPDSATHVASVVAGPFVWHLYNTERVARG